MQYIKGEMCKKLYPLCMECKEYEYDGFMKKIHEECDNNLTFRDLQKIAKKEYDDGSIGVGRSMMAILNYILAKKREETSLIEKYKKEVERIKDNNYMKKDNFYTIVTKRQEEANKRNTDILRDYLEGKTIEDKRGRSISDILYVYKDNMKESNYEIYVDSIIKSSSYVEPIQISELEHLIELLDYFINHLSMNLQMFRQFDLTDEVDIQSIIDFFVNGEDSLKDKYKSQLRNIYNWKIDIMEKQYKFYVDLRNIVEKIVLNRDFSEIERIDTSDDIKFYRYTDKLEKDSIESQIYDYYRLIKSYKKINSVVATSKDRSNNANKKLSQLLGKKLLLEDNK